MTNLVQRFDVAMRAMHLMASLEGRWAASDLGTRIKEHGGLATAKALLNAEHASEELLELCRSGRSDLTVEWMIAKNLTWHSLFTKEEVERAWSRVELYSNP